MNFKIILVTARSITIELEEDGYYHTEKYEIYLSGELISTSDKIIHSIYGLHPDTTYSLSLKRGKEYSKTIEIRTKSEFVTLNVRDFGAKGDGITDDTMFIQAAIMSCPENGRVYIPRGTYKFTNLFLKSNLNLEIGKGAVLSAIPDKGKIPILPGRVESYDEETEYLLGSFEGNPIDSYAGLITGINVENVLIHGEGTIDGSANFDNWWNVAKRKNDPAARPKLMFLNKCKNVTLQGLTITNSPCWNLHPYFSAKLRFIDLKILSPADSHNTDGIDPESCKDVEIIGVYFSVGDDCIAIKSGKIYMGKKYKTPSENIRIRHCHMEKGHGAVTVGSEIGAGVKDIMVENCIFTDTDRGLRIKTRRGRGKDSVLDGITFHNIYMDQVKTPFVVNCFYYCDPDGKTEYVATTKPLPVDERTPGIRKLSFKNIRCENAHVAGIYIYGLPEKKIEEIEMKNIHISFAEDAEPGTAAMMTECEKTCRKGIFIRNVEKLSMEEIFVTGNEGEAFDLGGVDKLE
ncbi:MAG: glycoside hydrolase family 28 protein [Clostridiales bacterium]|nr:glycoside hydrolase family 28 protein [Clostridiales bacterium]